ncbi:MAG: hypothetical protein AAFP03_14625 [Cyanobacteria bacterium J06598_3]
MTIKLIDDILNIAIAGLIYGSEIWLTCAFVLYVLRAKERKTKTIGLNTPQPGITITIEPVGTSLSQAVITQELDEQPLEEIPLEEISLQEQSLKIQPLEVSSETQPKVVTVNKANQDSTPKQAGMIASSRLDKTLPVKRLAVTQRTFPKKVVSPNKIVSQTTVRQDIVCEPVDWKRWKVGDLRRASIYKACGVRIRPIGSRRNLPKSDLIAQYEQNLKRLTKKPPVLAVRQNQTA